MLKQNKKKKGEKKKKGIFLSFPHDTETILSKESEDKGNGLWV